MQGIQHKGSVRERNLVRMKGVCFSSAAVAPHTTTVRKSPKNAVSDIYMTINKPYKINQHFDYQYIARFF